MACQVFEPPKTYHCQGIGKGAHCGKIATIPLRSNKWNDVEKCIEEIEVWVCAEHAKELQRAMNSNRACISSDRTLKPGEKIPELPETTIKRDQIKI